MATIAIIGLGKWGKNLVREFNNISCIKYCNTTGSVKNQSWLKENYPSIKFIKNYEIILKDSQIDAIIIATPINTQYRLVLKALNAKKHVFVEKPMASNFDQAKQLLSLAKKQNRLIFVGYVFLHHPVFKKIQQQIKNSILFSGYLSWKKYGTLNEDIFLDLVSHDIMIIQELFGRIQKISLKNKLGIFTKADIVLLEFLCSNKRKVICSVNRVYPIKNKSLFFTAKNFSLCWIENTLYKITKNSMKPIFFSQSNALENECKKFISSINKKPLDYSNAEKSLNVLYLLKQIKR